ncbi:MAG: gamma-glutamyltransferase [Gemmatimonadetes bacterium]|nr:gamma-glutamyltransferase [Gemmatimonadota bacterium]
MRSSRLWPVAAALILAVTLALVPSGVLAQSSDPVRAGTGMVVSESRIASEAGRDVLAAGGNAVDAAIATGFALAVTHPSAGNIGGGGFMVIRFPNGQTTAIDFREKAPLASHPEMWLENGEYSAERHHRSHWAVGVPGTVAGFDKAHSLYGDMNWERIVYPAVVLADDGFVLSDRLSGSLSRFALTDGRPAATVAQFSNGGTAYAAGETLRQTDLGRTLKRIMLDGRDGFYRGETARLLVAEMERAGGLITAADLEIYEARERVPVTGYYRGYEVISMPPPSSGGVAIVTMLNMLERFDLASFGHNTAPYIHHLSESMRRAFRDRAQFLADPDFVDVSVHALTSKEHAAELGNDIQSDRATPSGVSDIPMGYESPETTHYSVVDGNGMAVSVTYTLEGGFGTGIVVPGAGFLLNNEMGDFNAGPGLTNDRGLIGTSPNLARPQQRMLSSMTPSIVARDGRLVAVVGSPGGRTIINTVMQVILNVVDFGMNIQEAVNAKRIHHQSYWHRGRRRQRGDGSALGGDGAYRAGGRRAGDGPFDHDRSAHR